LACSRWWWYTYLFAQRSSNYFTFIRTDKSPNISPNSRSIPISNLHTNSSSNHDTGPLANVITVTGTITYAYFSTYIRTHSITHTSSHTITNISAHSFTNCHTNIYPSYSNPLSSANSSAHFSALYVSSITITKCDSHHSALPSSNFGTHWHTTHLNSNFSTNRKSNQLSN
jgi:hypothetical protein